MTCTCGEPAEWIDQYCQECWEAECSRTWWDGRFSPYPYSQSIPRGKLMNYHNLIEIARAQLDGTPQNYQAFLELVEAYLASEGV